MLTPDAEAAYRAATPDERDALLDVAPPQVLPDLLALERRMHAETSPAALAEVITTGRELQAPHLDLIGDAFADIDTGTVDRVGLFMPPRHGKSRRVRWGILWYLMRHPDRRVIVASYAQTLAEAHGRWLRDTIEAYHDILGFRLRPSSHAAARWDIDGTEGGLLAVGVGGGSTGHGAGLFVIDDPVKDAADAASLTMQDRAWDWWQAVAQTRLEPDGAVILIQTRWDPGDLGGRILADDPHAWHTVDLPAVAMHPDEYRAVGMDPVADPLGRAPGEALWPERYDADRLARIRRAVGERVWWALYQQQPRPPEGALLTRDLLRAARHPNPAATPVRHAVAVDPSGGGRDTAGIVAGWLGGDQRLYLTHDRSGRMPSGEWAREACVLAHETGADVIVVENNFGGDMAKLTLLTAWDALAREGTVSGVPPAVREVRARKGKLLRAEPIAGQWREDRIRTTAVMPELEHEWASWLPESPDSPGRIDASVYLAYALLGVPAGPAALTGAETIASTNLLSGMKSW